MSNLWRHIRGGMRQLVHSPGFALTSLATLALGIGGMTAIFTLIHAVLLQSLPVKHPEQLYRIGDNTFAGITGGLEDNFGTFSFELYQYFREHTPGFEELAASQAETRRISVRPAGSTAPVEALYGEFVSGNYFPMLGVEAAAGRILNASDDRAGAAPVVVISYEVWGRKFSRSAAVVGSTVNINSRPVVIAGVAQPGFYGVVLRPNPPDFWMPLAAERILDGGNSILDQPNMHWLFAIGRLRAGAKPAEMDAQLKVELKQWLDQQAGTMPADLRARLPKQTLRLTPAAGGIESTATVRNTYASGLRLLMTVSGFVLLIVCANLANLALVRGIGARQQTAIRVALGAARSRLVAQALTENIILAVAGGALGVALAYGAVPLLLKLAFTGAAYVPIVAHPSPPVLLFALLVSIVTGAVFGSAPAWIAWHTDPADTLRGAGRAAAASGHWSQRMLVVMQAALSLALLVASGLLIKSLRNLEGQNFGFQADRRTVARIDANLAGYRPEQLPPLERAIHDRLLRIPGALDVSYALYAPLSGSMWSTPIVMPGREVTFAGPSDWVAWSRVGPNYFEVIGTPILRGRGINEQDTASSLRVAVVNETFVRRFYPDGDAIGGHFGKAGPASAGDYEIVGIAQDTKYFNPNEAVRPMFALPMTQPIHYEAADDNAFEERSLYPSDVIVRLAGGSQGIEPQIRRALAEVDPNLAVVRVEGFRAQVDRKLNQQSLMVRLTSFFGLIALALASIGLYGVTAYTVERRTQEIGIRMALGAGRGMVMRLVLRGALLLVAIGLMLGIPVALGIGRILGSQLYGTRTDDPAVLGAAVAVLGAFALAASLLPARRAASVAPIRALRAE